VNAASWRHVSAVLALGFAVFQVRADGVPVGAPVGVAVGAPIAERGAALVIGQQAYSDAGQDWSSRADAVEVAAALKRAGWRVDAQFDLTAVQLRGAVIRFAGSLKSGEAALIYFSGLSAKGPGTNGAEGIENVLLGVDAKAGTPAALVSAGIPLAVVGSALNGVPVIVLIIDAARANTLEARWSVAPGLAEPTNSLLNNAFIVFPAAPGRLAREGLFVPQLVKAIDRPNLSVTRSMSGISLALDQATGGEQVPWYSGSSASARWKLRVDQSGALAEPPDQAAFDQAVACGTETCLLEAAAAVKDPIKAMDLRLRAAVAGAELAPPPSKKPKAAPSYVEAFVEANQSSAAGMGRLGQNYLHGLNGFPRDAGEAYGWLMRAATAGDARSNYEAALMFETGSPPVGHVDKYAAAPMFKQAAENGDRDAEYYLGLYYNKGEGGMPKNPELGAQWIAEAAKRGQPKAMDSLAHPPPTSAKPSLPD